MARGPNKMFAGGPKIIALSLFSVRRVDDITNNSNVSSTSFTTRLTMSFTIGRELRTSFEILRVDDNVDRRVVEMIHNSHESWRSVSSTGSVPVAVMFSTLARFKEDVTPRLWISIAYLIIGSACFTVRPRIVHYLWFAIFYISTIYFNFCLCIMHDVFFRTVVLMNNLICDSMLQIYTWAESIRNAASDLFWNI